ncbi:hypothetical protein [Rubrivirga sp.]|uniref:hypothetical protein n=1 Tax=Rubrivirga sp. TaxID=1885344 RepID=UPI003C748FAA
MNLSPILLVLVLVGCTHTRPADLSSASTRATINARAERGFPVLHLEGERGRQVRALRVAADSTFWVDKRTDEARSAPTAAIDAVVFRRDGYGALAGAGIGAVVGGASGFVGDPPFPFDRAFMVVMGAAGGAVVGAFSGAIRSDRVIYRARPFEVGVLEVVPAPCAGVPLACAAGLEGATD